MTTLPWYTDAEIDSMCEGLTSNAAKLRHLRRQGLTVSRKPNGRSLLMRSNYATENMIKRNHYEVEQ